MEVSTPFRLIAARIEFWALNIMKRGIFVVLDCVIRQRVKDSWRTFRIAVLREKF